MATEPVDPTAATTPAADTSGFAPAAPGAGAANTWAGGPGSWGGPRGRWGRGISGSQFPNGILGGPPPPGMAGPGGLGFGAFGPVAQGPEAQAKADLMRAKMQASLNMTPEQRMAAKQQALSLDPSTRLPSGRTIAEENQANSEYTANLIAKAYAGNIPVAARPPGSAAPPPIAGPTSTYKMGNPQAKNAAATAAAANQPKAAPNVRGNAFGMMGPRGRAFGQMSKGPMFTGRAPGFGANRPMTGGFRRNTYG